MFLAAQNAPEPVLARLERWVEAAWPEAVRWRHGTPEAGSIRLWSTGTRGSSRPHFHADPHIAVAVDGFLWAEPGEGEDSSEGGRPLPHLGRHLLRDDGWPLPEGWDGSFAAVAFELAGDTPGRNGPGIGRAALAIDAVGLRRVFHVRRGEVWIAGCLEAPLAHGLGLAPDPMAVAENLAAFTALGRRGLFVGVEELMPGERLRLIPSVGRSRELERRSHLPWVHGSPSPNPGSPHDPEAAAEDLAPRLRRQVLCFVEDPPGRVGIALSSGLDSRLVLGALGKAAAECPSYTYGHPEEIEMSLAARSAAAMGSRHTKVGLVGRYFPSVGRVRREAIACASTSYPFWPAMGEAAERDGVATLLLGDITNCLQTRAEALWSRSARLRGRLPLAAGGADGAEAGPWIRSEIEHVASISAGLSRAVGLEVGDPRRWQADLRESVAEGMAELTRYLGIDEHTDLVTAQERTYLALERKRGGGQARSLAGRSELIPVLATAGIVGPALCWPARLRAGRRLLRHIAARLLPRDLARVPTATIPWASPLAPLWWQDALWLTRFAADQALGAVSRRFSDRVQRASMAPGFPLRPEHRLASEGVWGRPWAASGCFSSEFYRGRLARAAAGRRPALVPITELHAAGLDAQLAAALHGPDPTRWPEPR
ncbi:MAG: asparagine synthase-related protein [Holophagales bacterium]|nr:asparagine synthase-related protein [Holophagales bacterium]